MDELKDLLAESKKKGKTASSSFHDPKELEDCELTFDYQFLSPVFSSISKPGYEGRGFDVNHIDKKTIGMGGIKADTVLQTLELGYLGIGVLGAVWHSDNPVDSFIELDQVYASNAL